MGTYLGRGIASRHQVLLRGFQIELPQIPTNWSKGRRQSCDKFDTCLHHIRSHLGRAIFREPKYDVAVKQYHDKYSYDSDPN